VRGASFEAHPYKQNQIQPNAGQPVKLDAQPTGGPPQSGSGPPILQAGRVDVAAGLETFGPYERRRDADGSIYILIEGRRYNLASNGQVVSAAP
jgi:hypothetical protein